MPFVDTDVHAHLARKRRWQGDTDDEDIRGLYNAEQPGDIFFLHHDQPASRTRKIVPLSKRPRIITTDSNHTEPDTHPLRRRKPSLSSLDHGVDDRSGARPLLAPCHVCHRKPTKKSHLDSYADCQGCGERTCFVCIRQCQTPSTADGDDGTLSDQEALSRSFQMEDFTDATTSSKPEEQYAPPTPVSEASHEFGSRGWHARGHRSVICSRCCIERGAEGDVVCLGCLSMEGA
jgi:hypothetical protein